MVNFLATAILAALLLIAAPVRATDCVDTTEALNRITAAHPGSQVIAIYEDLAAQMYIKMLNASPWGPPLVVGDTVIIMKKAVYDSVLVLVFHEHSDRACATIGVAIPADAHERWNSIITGLEL
jgi:hypothetical protein